MKAATVKRPRDGAICRWAGGLACGLGSLTASSAAWGQGSSDPVEQARIAYNAGARDFSAKRFAEAAAHFDDAASFAPNAVALFTGALAWEHAGKIPQAADDYARALAGSGLDDKQRARAKERLFTLEPELGSAHVIGPAGARARIDDGSLTLPLPATLHAAPGAHVLLIVSPAPLTGPAPPPEARPVVLAAGTTTEVDVTPPAIQAASITPTAHEDSSPPGLAVRSTARKMQARRTIGYVLVGIGAAAEISAAGIWYGAALGARDDYQRTGSSDDRSRAKSLELWTNVALFGGGALIVAGAACVLWPSTPTPTATAAQPVLSVQVGPASIRLRGEW